MLNKVMLIGRLGRDPELRYTQNGTPVTTLNVATDESYVDREGNKVERTEWHRVTVFQRQAENCSTFLSKGSLVYVEGSLQTRKWMDQNNQERYTTEVKAQRVQFLERKGDSARQASEEGGYSRQGQQGRSYQQRGNQQGQRSQQMNEDRVPPQPKEEDMGPVFPSEAATASGLDEVPF